MESLYSNKYIKIENNNSSNQINIDKSFNNSFQRENCNTDFTTFHNTSQIKNNISNYERYKNQQFLNQTRLPDCKCYCTCHFNSSNCNICNHCHQHHFHMHHIHIPSRNLNDILHFENISNFKTTNTSFIDSNNLLKEVTELRNECRKFKEELDRNLNEKSAENIYIRELENEIYKNINENNSDDNNRNNNENKENERNNNFNRYHDMLNKSFDVLKSVSNKSKDKNCRTKGEIYYYMNNNDDFERLIQVQKNWIANLPDDNTLPNNNFSTNKTYTINDQNQDDTNNNNNIYGITNNSFNNSNNKNQRNNTKYNNDNITTNENNYDNKNQNNYNDLNEYNNDNNINQESNNNFNNNNKETNPSRHFDSNRNNNKGYIINRGDKINNNYTENNNGEKPPLSNNITGNYKTFPENINNNNEDEDNNNEEEEINTDNNINNNKNKTTPNLNNQNKNNEQSLNNNNNASNKEEEENESNPLNERYLILDENGNPIVVNGNKLLGMDLYPLIGEDGKEVIDDNGNIVLIGPDGQPKSQDELEPIILDNDKPLVNEENKPYLGLCGVPLISGEGNPIVGPDELYDNDNKVVEGMVGMVAKDNMGNPIKVNIKDSNKEPNNNNNNNKDELNENDNNEMEYEDNNDNYIKSKSNQTNNNDNNGNNNIEGRENEDSNNNGDLINFNKLKPLLGPDGIPLRDSNNEYILVDENNIPVKNPGISILTDKSGKPVLNSLGMPVFIDREGNPLNTNGNLQPQKVYYNKKEAVTYGIGDNPPDRELKKDSFKIGYINENNNNKKKLKNKKRMYKDNDERKEMNYDECNPESLKKVNFMRPYSNPFYDDNEYKVKCFACNLGCGVSKSGYSPMNFSPYNHLIRRRSITPLKENIQLKNRKNSKNSNIKKINMGNDNNYYLTGN